MTKHHKALGTSAAAALLAPAAIALVSCTVLEEAAGAEVTGVAPGGL